MSRVDCGGQWRLVEDMEDSGGQRREVEVSGGHGGHGG